ncbi:hypothetical protein NM688_g535 [Phlebia brevispora]|uniref:Uncharacterized protein n=1 Tax=Phlebia brevispora TaxID=194682 RepID=A0ACC1TDT6_9APHY|nr:hypothetical protein NM688_g535 [Phlebia brevispora]
MGTTAHTDPAEIKEVYARLARTFKSGKTRPLEWRRRQILQLAHLLQDSGKMIEDSLLADLRKPRLESAVIEVATVVLACVNAVELLEEWNKPEKPTTVEFRSTWDVTVYKEPKGLALMITPWNYPFIITFLPLIGAMAAGCPAVVKPSELSPHSSATMASLFAKYLDPDAYVVVQGGPDIATELLALRWDHIFFTGSGRVGRIIAAAAAKHVTPLTLELGGKCPVIIDSSCDVELAAKRTLYGKTQNAGQVCVAPDYVLVHRAVKPAFEAAIQKAYNEMFPNGVFGSNVEYSKIINRPHIDRLVDLIKRTKGKIIVGGETEGDTVTPTVVTDIQPDDALMEDEVFGPILSIIEVQSMDEAVDFIRSRPSPLAVYCFTTTEVTKQKFLGGTQSGSLILNDTFMQLSAQEAPFGGKGESGYGSYFGKNSFDSFVHRRTYINMPHAMEPMLALRYPPYTEEAYKILSAGAHIEIPAV